MTKYEVAVVAQYPPHLARGVVVVDDFAETTAPTAGTPTPLPPEDPVSLGTVDAVPTAELVIVRPAWVFKPPLSQPFCAIENHYSAVLCSIVLGVTSFSIVTGAT